MGERDHLADVRRESERARKLYPRVDRVIAKPRGRLRKWLRMAPRTRVLRGVPYRTASLATLHGVKDVPAGWRHVGDISVPSGQSCRVRFRGPFDV